MMNKLKLYWWACTECGMVWPQIDAHEFRDKLNEYYKYKVDSSEAEK